MSAKLLTLPTLAIALISASSLIAEEAVHWSYKGNTGPENWANLSKDYAACAGNQQSPIDINTATAIDAELMPLEINWNEMVDLNVANNGHAIQDNSMDLGDAVINGKAYTLKQFHFHHPSEHTIDGQAFPTEVHFVHAAEDGSLAVVAVLLTGGGANMVFDDSLASATPTEGKMHLGNENPRELLPEDMSVFHYQGSLTTPPCSEIVDWNILQTPVQVSDLAIEMLGQIYENDARPVQDIARRFILK